MSYLKRSGLLLVSFLMAAFSVQVCGAQNYKVNTSASELIVEGTSNLHDWEIEAEEMKGSLSAEISEGKIADLSQLDFTVVTESLKSGKSGMDKNTYKALKTKKYDQISYTLSKVNSLDCTSGSECKIATTGQLNIAGTKKNVDITFTAGITENKITLSGSKKLDITEFNVEPPTAMFGAITTGKDVTIKFKTEFKK